MTQSIVWVISFEALFSDNWLMRWELFSSGLFPKLFFERLDSVQFLGFLLFFSLLVTVSNLFYSREAILGKSELGW